MSGLRFASVTYSSGQGVTEGPLRTRSSDLYNPPASRRSALSCAVVPALGQETARTMRRFQARKWPKLHRGFSKKAFARPLHREGKNKVTPSACFADSSHNLSPKNTASFFGDLRGRLK